MVGPLLVLSVGAAGIGLIGSPWGGHGFQHFLGIEAHHGEGLPETKGMIAVAGILLALLRYGWNKHLPEGLRAACAPVYTVVANKYYIDEIYERFIVNPVMGLTQKAALFDAKIVDEAVNQTGLSGLRLSRLKNWIDQVIVDGAVNGVGATFGRAGAILSFVQTGLVQNYLLIAVGFGTLFYLVLRWVP